MYDEQCLSHTQKAWLEIETTLQHDPSQAEAVACLKRVQHLLNHCIQSGEQDGKHSAKTRPKS